MFVETKKNMLDTVRIFKKQEQNISGVTAFKRKGVIFVGGLEKIDEQDRSSFLDAIKFELGDCDMKSSKATFLAKDNETWFDVVRRARGKSGVLPIGEYVAMSPEKESLASLFYVGRRALISGKTEYLVSVSNKDNVDSSIYDQLVFSFVNDVAQATNAEEKNESFGLSFFVTAESNNKQAQELTQRMANNAKAYGCKEVGYFGQDPEDYQDKVFRAETLPATHEKVSEASAQIMKVL